MITIKLTEKEIQIIRLAITSSDYFPKYFYRHFGVDEEDAKVMRSIFKKLDYADEQILNFHRIITLTKEKNDDKSWR